MSVSTTTTRQEVVARRALARSAIYQLLSQALAYPSDDTVAALRQEDMSQARDSAVLLDPKVLANVDALKLALGQTNAESLQKEHRRIFTHILSLDCPPCETVYTAQHIFQETQELSDIAGFFRAFGLERAEPQRPDHISLELEFMHFLTFKEAYAALNHGPSKARFCRHVQRKFLREHLGRWAPEFARRLEMKAEGGYYQRVAALTTAFTSYEVGFLRVRPELVVANPDWRTMSPQDDSCAETDCPLLESGQGNGQEG